MKIKSKTLLNQSKYALDALVAIVQAYIALGTPGECKVARDKQTAKKPSEQSCEEKTLFKCNNCGYIMKIKYSDGTVFGHSPNYCEQCGQKMDWSKNDKGRS